MVLKKSDAKNRQGNDNRSHSRNSRSGTPGLPGRDVLGLRPDSYVLFDIDNDIPNKHLEHSISAVRGPLSGQWVAIPMGGRAARRTHAAGWLVRPVPEPGEPYNRTNNHGDEHFG